MRIMKLLDIEHDWLPKRFSQRSGIDYEETYSLVVDATTFQYLISLIVCEKLEMHLIDVITTYLYGSLDN